MPYRRKYRKRASKLATKKEVNKMIKRKLDESIEDKHKDVIRDGFAVLTDGNFIVPLLNDIPRGTGPSQRIGDTIKLKYVHLNYVVTAEANNTFNKIRVLVVQYSIFTGLTPAAIYEPNQIGGLNSTMAQINYDQSKAPERVLRVLYDKTHRVYGGEYSSVSVNNLKIYRNMVKKISYDGNTETIPLQNQIYVCAISDSLVAPNPTMNFIARVVYEDA